MQTYISERDKKKNVPNMYVVIAYPELPDVNMYVIKNTSLFSVEHENACQSNCLSSLFL